MCLFGARETEKIGGEYWNRTNELSVSNLQFTTSLIPQWVRDQNRLTDPEAISQALRLRGTTLRNVSDLHEGGDEPNILHNSFVSLLNC